MLNCIQNLIQNFKNELEQVIQHNSFVSDEILSTYLKFIENSINRKDFLFKDSFFTSLIANILESGKISV